MARAIGALCAARCCVMGFAMGRTAPRTRVQHGGREPPQRLDDSHDTDAENG